VGLGQDSVYTFKSSDVAVTALSVDEALAKWARKFDPVAGSFFFVEKKTGEVSKTRPVELGEVRIPLTPRTETSHTEYQKRRKVQRHGRRKSAAEMTKWEALITVQSAWRVALAWRRTRLAALLVYKKAYDSDAACPYYWNPRTGVSAYMHPRLLGSSDVRMTPRRQLPGSGSTTPRGEELLAEYDDTGRSSVRLSAKEAIQRMQGCARRWVALRVARRLALSVFVKLIDEDSEYPYYYNTRTHVSQWHKPTILGKHLDAPIAPASTDSSRASTKTSVLTEATAATEAGSAGKGEVRGTE